MKKVNPVRIFPIVFGNKAAAAAAVSFFNTERTGAGWFRSDVSNDALRDACLQSRGSRSHRFHSGDELERRTWRQTIRHWAEENQFQSPEDGWCRRSRNTNSCFVALESGGGFYLTTTTSRQEPGPARHYSPWSRSNSNGNDYSGLSTIHNCSLFFWSSKSCFFVDRPSGPTFSFQLPPSVLASISHLSCDVAFYGSCHKFEIRRDRD